MGGLHILKQNNLHTLPTYYPNVINFPKQTKREFKYDIHKHTFIYLF